MISGKVQIENNKEFLEQIMDFPIWCNFHFQKGASILFFIVQLMTLLEKY